MLRVSGFRGMTPTQVILSCAVAALCAPISGLALAQGGVEAGRIKAETCMGCHGIPGYSMVYPTYHVPKLGGQHAEYIVSALQGYKTGQRHHEIMHAQAMSLSTKDMEDIAAYFESLGNATPAGGEQPQQAAKSSGGGQKQVAKSGAAAGGTQVSGKQTFAQVCSTCHQTGSMGAPKFGNEADWAPRIKEGKQTLYSHALHGYKAMPAKGGHPELSDAQVKAGVDYMVAQVSGGSAAAAAPKAGGKKPTTAKQAPAKDAGAKKASSQGAAKPSSAGGATLAKGKEVYQMLCSSCHASGLLGAPKFGDKAAWAARAKLPKQALYQAAINGIGNMPAKGGDSSLSDEQVTAAVDYMLSAVTTEKGQ